MKPARGYFADAPRSLIFFIPSSLSIWAPTPTILESGPSLFFEVFWPFKKEIFDGCYLDAKSTLGNQRAKQYCTCTTEMLHRKFSDEEILIIGQKSQDQQMQAFSFASNYCNKNADAPD